MNVRLALLCAFLILVGRTAGAQDVQDVLRAVSANMGADGLNCVTYTATGYVGLVGQTFDMRTDWPRVAVSSYTRSVNYPARSMHEERVVHQRSHREYNGPMATNARYLMDYILNRCRAPDKREVVDVPIKLWVKYMPDFMEHLIRDMHSSESVRLEMFRDGENSAANGAISAALGEKRTQ